MIQFRSKAPEAQRIISLEYPIHEEILLKGNVRLLLFPPATNEVIQLLSYWPTGSQSQKIKYQSKSALMLSLNGTIQHTAEQIQDQFDYWGSVITPHAGIFHSDLSLKSTKEYFIPAFNWFIDNYLNAEYPESELNTFKQTSIASLQRKMTTPKYWAYKECMELVYGSDSVMTRFATSEDINSIGKADLSMFHKDFLNPLSATFFLSGDYSDRDIQSIETAISGLQNTSTPSPGFNNIDSVSDVSEKILHVDNTSQVSLFMVRELPFISETEYHHISLLNLVLGGFFGSRLMQEIREEKGLTYGIGSYIMQTHTGNVWCISGEMNSANAGIALDETRKILRELISNPPSGAELDRAKRYYAGQLRGSFDGPFAMASKIRNLMVRGFSLKHIDTAMDSIWSCTTEDLCALADNYLHPHTFKTVLAGDIHSN